MFDVDLNAFWKDDKKAHEDNCFSKAAPQAALGIRMSDECVFAELGEEGNPWGYTDPQRRLELNKRYNEKAVEIIGIPLLSENKPEDAIHFPYVKRIGEVFGGRYFMHNESEYLEGDVHTPEELEKLLDRVEALDLASFMFPDNWETEKKRIFEETGRKPAPQRHIRGPVTLATSIYGVNELIYLYYDDPELYERFSRVIGDVIIKMTKLNDIEADFAKDFDSVGNRWFSFADDNCCLLKPEMYEDFGYPILKRVFDEFTPEPGDSRYQHSDSDMGHLLPLLAKVNLTGCNFGPTVTVDMIRKYMPKTRIDGCLAPFTFMNNDTEQIIAQVRRDCDMAREMGYGLNVMTAGSINNGSSLESMRAVMYAIQNFGRY